MNNVQLIEYLEQEQGVSARVIALATRTRKPTETELPIVLWNHGLIDLEQLGAIFDWLEEAA
ncbi:MAG: DUF2949 domain-containing protein [Thermosynechococcaceae cyanobacterium]